MSTNLTEGKYFLLYSNNSSCTERSDLITKNWNYCLLEVFLKSVPRKSLPAKVIIQYKKRVRFQTNKIILLYNVPP